MTQALTFLASPLMGILGLAAKQPKIPGPLPIATRDDAIQAQTQQDDIARRRGGAADIISGAGGPSGAEASPSSTGKATLGS